MRRFCCCIFDFVKSNESCLNLEMLEDSPNLLEMEAVFISKQVSLSQHMSKFSEFLPRSIIDAVSDFVGFNHEINTTIISRKKFDSTSSFYLLLLDTSVATGILFTLFNPTVT